MPIVADRASELRNWFEGFEKRRLEDREKEEDQRDPALVRYQERTSHATDGVDSLRFRMETPATCVHGCAAQGDLDSRRQVLSGHNALRRH